MKLHYFLIKYSCSKAFHMTIPAQTDTLMECLVPT